MIKIELPWPPTVNHYYGTGARGRRYIKPEGVAYRHEVKVAMLQGRHKPIDGPLAVTILAYPPDRRRRDIDNINKALLDALQHAGAYRDDCQIIKLTSEKKEPKPGAGCVRVTIEEA